MKIFIILSRVPYPLEKGDKLRAFNQIKELSKNNEVYLFALNDLNSNQQAIAELLKYCKEVTVFRLTKLTIVLNLIRTLFDGKPFQVGYFYSKKAQVVIDTLIKKYQPNHIYCQLIRTAEYVRPYPNIPRTLDFMDIFSKGMERRKSTSPFYLKPILGIEYRRLLTYENKIFDSFTNKTIISEQDKSFLPHPDKEEIVVIPNGVDTSYFKPMESKKEFELLFNGNMNYPPNIESVQYLVNKVMPLIWKQKPEVRLLISGANPNSKVLELKSDRVVVSGWMNDIRENFAKSKILAAPMQISIGLQNKLLEAMAMKLPCVTSTLANNALKAKPNEQILVADTPEEYAKSIVSLLNDEAMMNRIAENGYQYALSNFNWHNTTKLLEKLFQQK
ncbi:MAG TPA: glycosyltransferase [Bacteroidia bacterium]|nr:glycosyltransferase [Bacteroidia bacterium]HRG52688.1 glycosyltransferase [Bacteroidia bacterium]